MMFIDVKLREIERANMRQAETKEMTETITHLSKLILLNVLFIN